VTRDTIIARLRAVVAADDAITHIRADHDAGMIVCRDVWRWAYAAREKVDREAWGTHADDRAAFARELLAVLENDTSETP